MMPGPPGEESVDDEWYPERRDWSEPTLRTLSEVAKMVLGEDAEAQTRRMSDS